MQRSKRQFFAAASFGIAAAAAVLSGCGETSVAAVAPVAPAPEVGVLVVQPQKVALTTELAGRTSPYVVAEVRPQVAGIVKQRLFQEGADVRAGEVLYQIDPATYQATYDSARASLAKAQANLATARTRAERYRELVAITAVSQQDYDEADGALQQAQAEIALARAAVETARINLGYTRVTSPISGRISRSSVTPGALVTAHQAATMTTVQQLDPIYVDVTQSSAELLRLKRELESGRLKSAGANQAAVGLLLEDGTPYPVAGKLQFSDVTVDQGTGTITLRAVFPNPKGLLLPGMYVRAVLPEGVDEHAILAPQQAVTRDAKGNPTALVLGAEGKVEQRALKTTRTVGDKWLVTEGLKPGDQLIVDGLQKIRPGVTVKGVPAATVTSSAPAAVAQK
jgi:membrane fusion protein (multidrug efflux system)